MSQTLYLKYRPQTFSDLDVAEARKFFLDLIKSGKLPHAFLFTGPKGIGKTSSARLLAKAVNCEKREGDIGEPCNKCEACVSINEGRAMDVLEIDAASNRGIEDIRELREKIKLAPVSLDAKVFIIDECHMLTTEASNALLKTLEEPPTHTIFVLCTTELHKVLPTIASRCTQVSFRMATNQEITEKLQKVVKGEDLDVSPEAIAMIAKSAQGSFRDGVKLIEQAAVGGKKIDTETVKNFLGFGDSASPVDLIKKLVSKDLKNCFLEIEKISSTGVSPRTVIERALELMREELLIKIGVTEGEPKFDGLTNEELIKLVRSFERAGREAKDSVIPTLPLELMAVEWCGESEASEEPRIEKKILEKLETVVVDMEVKENKVDLKRTEEIKVEKAPKPETDQVPNVMGKIEIAQMEKKWNEILKIIRPQNHSVEAFLRSTKPVAIQGDRFVLDVFYKFHKERLETEKSRILIEDTIEKVIGLKLKLVFNLRDKAKAQTGSEHSNISGKEVEEEIIKAAEDIFGVEAV